MKKLGIVCLTTVSIVTLVACAEQAASRARVATPSTTAATTSLNMIPAGTSLQVRTNDRIVADSNSVGRTYSGQIAGDVLNSSGSTLIPRGSPVTFVVLSTSRGGVTGGGELQLGIQSIDVIGKMLGIGEESGLPLSGEQTGNMPGPEWMQPPPEVRHPAGA